MINRKELTKGWQFIGSTQGAQIADFVGQDYISKVAKAIDELEQAINDYEGSGKAAPQLGGDIAEEWAAGTFNVRAVAAESLHRAFADRSNEHASVDVSTNFDDGYSLKYLKYADRSVKAQAKNVIQNYHEYLSQSKANGTKAPMSFEEYLSRYNYSDDLEDLLMSVYRGQGRIIPSDQLEEGIQKLRQLIATEAARGSEARLANLRNYEETLRALSDRIRDGEGVESIPLSKDESHAIAELCKTGDFNPEDFGITLESEITSRYILNQAIKAGITATVITLAIQMVPEMFSLISALIKDHKISKNQLKNSGIKSLTAGAKGFIVGGLACGIYTACKAGKLGAPFTKIQPGVIGTIVALAFNVIVDSFEYATGQEDELRYKYNITKCAIVSAASLAGGTIAVSVLPIANALAFVIGSIVGSVTASITMSIEERVLLSFCVNSGFTLFGLVKQDYVLPAEVFKGMGLSLVELNKINPNISKISVATINRAIPSIARPGKVDIQILKRGIISFHTIGYVFLTRKNTEDADAR